MRDPRGVLLSRIRGDMLSYENVNTEAKVLCRKMLEDMWIIHSLKQQHPGSVLINSYEQLTRFPMSSLEKILQVTGMPRSEAVRDWLEANSVNGANISSAWRTRISPTMKATIDAECKELYKAAGYPI